MPLRSILQTTPCVLAIASLSLLAACGGGGGDAAPPSPTAAGGPPSATVGTVDAKNVNQVGIESYKFASDVFDATYAAAEQLKSTEATRSTPGLNVAGLALERVQRMFGASERGVSSKSLAARKAVLSETEPCESGQIVATFNDVNGNDDIDAGESGSVQFRNCMFGGVLFTGSFSMFVNSVSSTATVDSADVSFTFNDFSSTDSSIGFTASGKGDLRLSASVTYATAQSVTPSSVTATFSGNQLISTTQGTIRTMSTYAGDLTLAPASNSYSYRLQGTASASTLPGAMTFSTPVAVQGIYGGEVIAGTFVAKAQDGSTARMVVTPPTGVTVGLDANGDGTFEASTPFTWAQFMAL
jgi:hypothetical protein